MALDRRFGWLWASFAVSAAGTWLAFDAFALIAIVVLHAGPAVVSSLAAAGPAVGAALAVVAGPWAEHRRRRPVMIGADLLRALAVASVPVAFATGMLGVGQLLVVSVLVAAADIAFLAASGAYLRALVADPGDLLVANGRFESTTWTATALGPPLGGLAIGLFGPVTTVVANAVSFLLSAAGLAAIGRAGDASRSGPGVRRSGSWRTGAPSPAAGSTAPRLRAGDLLAGWRILLAEPSLRRLFGNTVLVNGLIMATAPPAAVLMLGELGFAPWQYALAFGAPCAGGLVGARLAPVLVARYGRAAVLRGSGALRAVWPVGIAFVTPGPGGLVLVLVVQFCLVTCIGVFSPVLATHRLEHLPGDGVVRGLTAWSVSTKASIAALTAATGVLAGVTGPRTAVAVAGGLVLATPLLLPRRGRSPHRTGGGKPGRRPAADTAPGGPGPGPGALPERRCSP